MRYRLLISVLLLWLASPTLAQPTFPGETQAQRDARMQWWRDAKFGMFIHWGASTYLGGEWEGENFGSTFGLMRTAKLAPADYAEAVRPFNPVDFDAEQWVLQAKRFGVKYLVLTAKHHDGFALWHSKVSNFNIIDGTDFDRDIVAELSAACQKHDMKLGFYYSHARDWYHPGAKVSWGNVDPWHPSQDGEFADYVENLAVPQVRELLSNYGPVAVMWWDTPDKMDNKYGDDFTPLLRLQPKIISNSRLLGPTTRGGDFLTHEQYIPAKREPAESDMEICMTMGSRWMWYKGDKPENTARQLLHNLLHIASLGGNYLLNVGPTPQGTFPDWQVERLDYIGDWLNAYGEAIYGTRQGPFRYWENGYATVKGNTLYLLITQWPEDGKLYVPISNVPRAAHSLAYSPQTFTFESTDKGLFIDVPKQPLDDRASVVVLELSEPAVAIRQGRLPGDDGAYHLTAVNGAYEGLVFKQVDDYLTQWSNDAYKVTWPIYIEQPGSYRVQLVYSCHPDKAGATMVVHLNDQEVSAKVQPTASWNDYQTFDVGSVTFDNEQSVEVELNQLDRPDRNAVRFKELIVTREQ